MARFEGVCSKALLSGLRELVCRACGTRAAVLAWLQPCWGLVEHGVCRVVCGSEVGAVEEGLTSGRGFDLNVRKTRAKTR